MEILNQDDIHEICKSFKADSVIKWEITELADKMVGYLGEHYKLTVHILRGGTVSNIRLFLKTIPLNDLAKAEYIRNLNFFVKEHGMLSKLFQEFGVDNDDDCDKWRPKLYLIKEELFVFEDVTELGYQMPSHLQPMEYEDITSVVISLAKFHAQSYIYEETRSLVLEKEYRIWEEYQKYLMEPSTNENWRKAGMNNVIDCLKEFSKYRHRPDFINMIHKSVPNLFLRAKELMAPSKCIRNCVVHRDLWQNNLFIKRYKGDKRHTLLIDFQTVLYASPCIDLASLLFFNTSASFRDKNLTNIIDLYYERLSNNITKNRISMSKIFDKSDFLANYKVSELFGLIQAALIVPITALSPDDRDRIFGNPKTLIQVKDISRSKELIAVARRDSRYRLRVMELFEEIENKYIFSNDM